MKANARKAAKYLGKVSVKVQEFMKNYPPVFENKIKRDFFKSALFYHRKQHGIVKISRWTYDTDQSELYDLQKLYLDIQNSPDFFSYEEGNDDEKVWWLNFADEYLFGYYGSNLFAQDEIKTFEHPLLGSIVEFLDSKKIPEMDSLTEEKKRVTPYLIEDIPQWINVNVNPTLPNGEKGNIYGWKFAQNPREIIDRGVSIIQKDKKNNIIAMSAPSGGKGKYTTTQLIRLMKTTIVAFGAAVKTGKLERYKRTIIHTDNWGCGAFGNNQELMYLSQILAASLVGVDTLIFHSADSKILEQAKNKYQDLKAEDIIYFLEKQHYHWRFSDDN